MHATRSRTSTPHGDPAATGRPQTVAPDVVVLSSSACHLCDDALEALREFALEFPIRVREVDMETPEGGELVGFHRPAMPPAIVIDGVLFSSGRLPRKKLRKLLERTS